MSEASKKKTETPAVPTEADGHPDFTGVIEAAEEVLQNANKEFDRRAGENSGYRPQSLSRETLDLASTPVPRGGVSRDTGGDFMSIAGADRQTRNDVMDTVNEASKNNTETPAVPTGADGSPDFTGDIEAAGEKLRNANKKVDRRAGEISGYRPRPLSRETLRLASTPVEHRGFWRETGDDLMAIAGVGRQKRNNVMDTIGWAGSLVAGGPEKIEERLRNKVEEAVGDIVENVEKDVSSKIRERFAKHAPQLKALGGGMAVLLGVYLLSRLFRSGGGGGTVNVYANAPARPRPLRRWNRGSLFRG